jgi:hypothetical protein
LSSLGTADQTGKTTIEGAAVRFTTMSEEVAVGRQEEDVPIADATNTGSSAMTDEDAELEAMKARMLEMEAEAAKLREMTAQSEAANQGSSGGQSAAIGPSEDEKEEVDARSVYVGNVRTDNCTASMGRG